jgi:nucleoside-diphosphate-sugar epimerase
MYPERQWKGMKILITGSSGYLGYNTVLMALERGYDVVGYDLKPSGVKHEAYREFTGDITEPDALRVATEGCEAIFHLAAALAQFMRDEKRMSAVNVAGTANVLKAAYELGARKFVFTSSVEVYGIDIPAPCKEEAPLAPVCQYGRDKVEAEKLCRNYLEKGLDVTIFRPPTIHGRGQNEPFLVSQMIGISQGKATLLPGGGRTRLQMVNVDDVSSALFLALEKPESKGEVFNLGSDNVPTLRTMAEALYRHAGKQPKFIVINANVARAAVRLLSALHISPLEPQHLEIALRDYVFDNTRAKRMLGWKPTRDDIQSSIEAYDYLVKQTSGLNDSRVVKG